MGGDLAEQGDLCQYAIRLMEKLVNCSKQPSLMTAFISRLATASGLDSGRMVEVAFKEWNEAQFMYPAQQAYPFISCKTRILELRKSF